MSRLLPALLLLTAAAGAQPDNPVRWSFLDPAIEGRASVGAVIKVRIKAAIEEGWHLYSLKPMEGGPIATRISLPEGQPFALAGAIEAPSGEQVHDPVFDLDVEYWSESVELVLPVRIAGGATGRLGLKITVRYQTCTEKLCLPPRTVTLERPVEIR